MPVGKVLNVRLDDETHRSVVRIAKAKRRSKSEIVRQAIAEFAKRRQAGRTACDAWQGVIGIAKGLRSDLSQRTAERFTQMLRQQHRRKRRRSTPRTA
jgi:predicted transcriptional regulator